MNIYSNYNLGTEDPIAFLDFEKFSSIVPDNIDFYFGGHPHPNIFRPTLNKRIFFSTEEQSWSLDTTDNCIDCVDKILTICPPDITGRAKREFVFFPISEDRIPPPTEKDIDAIYCGIASGPHVSQIINAIRNYNYCFVSSSHSDLVTNFNVTYRQKLDLINRSKIGIVHNLTGNGTPQIKTRVVENAACRSAILCKKDNWNLIERFFTPNEDFLYFDSDDDLRSKIDFLLENDATRLEMTERAYTKLINNYTTEHFVQKYLC